MMQRVAEFSGGERARLALALIAWQKPNLLLLDEPTNHLDMEMRQALAVAVEQFEGAVVLVSHDRHLLNALAEDFIWVRDGGVEHFEGSLDEYERGLQAEIKARASASRSQPAAAAYPVAAPVEELSREEQREREKKLVSMQKKAASAEQALAETQERLEGLQSQLADGSLYEADNAARLKELLAAQSEVQSRLDRGEADYLELLESIEALDSMTSSTFTR
jgi:ATP-binding cassette subfamily F protein 3